MLSHRNSGKYSNTLVVVLEHTLVKVVGFGLWDMGTSSMRCKEDGVGTFGK